MAANLKFIRWSVSNKAAGVSLFRSGRPVSAFSTTRVALVALVAAVGFSGLARAEARADSSGSAGSSDALIVKPDKCISLRQGLVCYQRIRFDWSVAKSGDYCLIEESAMSPLICWTQLRSGSYITEFAASESKTYHLINKSTEQKVDQVTMQVSWVYRSKRRSRGRWRLF